MTDRRVLDKQLQDTIYQFEHKQGVVRKIDEDSEQLADSLASGTRIVITTLQKFSFVLDKIKELPKRNYALIVDEAHSSQTGEAASNLRRVLAATSLDEAEGQDVGEPADVEDEIVKVINARGPQKNLSFFAFTATPKHKTLEMFGSRAPDGKPRPFHLYSMRQAIEEGFILDVLRNYTTYKTYYKLTKAIEDDPEVDRTKATKRHRPVRQPPPPQPRPEDRGHGRALPQLHREEGRRPGEGDGRHPLPAPCGPLQAGIRQVPRGAGLLATSGCWSPSRGRSATAASITPRRR